MKKTFILVLISSLLSVISCRQQEEKSVTTPSVNTPQRLISLSGMLTETLFTLGHGDKIIGRDITSTYPVDVQSIASLGHVNKLNTEAVLGLKPDIVFVEEKQVAQAQGLAQLKAAGIQVAEIKTSETLGNAVAAAKQIQEFLPTDLQKVQMLADKIKADSSALVSVKVIRSQAPKVLFIYARGAGRLLVAGTNTSAASVIELAGGQNAINEFEGFKPMTPEALITANPDIILMFDSGLESLEGKKGLASIPGVAQTKAYQNDRIIAMDGHYLTAFGPRAAEAVADLAEKFHEDQNQ